MWSKLGKNY